MLAVVTVKAMPRDSFLLEQHAALEKRQRKFGLTLANVDKKQQDEQQKQQQEWQHGAAAKAVATEIAAAVH